MIARIQFALCKAWEQRKVLKEYSQDPTLQSKSVLEIDPLILKRKGIAALAIDCDGVLVAHGETLLSKEVDKWLRSCIAVFGVEKVFILTNKPMPVRLQYFSEHYGNLTLVHGTQKKPYPAGVLKILHIAKIHPDQLLVIDDRLLTGILAAIIANTKALYITKPYIALSKRPIQELFFIILRFLERFGIKWGS